MDKSTIMTVLMGVLIIATVFQAFELNGLKGQLAAKTGGVSLASAPSQSASGGETQDQMMRRMHPDQYAQQQAASNALGGGQLANVPSQVGGC